MLEIGRACVKIAGKEANRKCVVIDTIDDTFVTIAGPRIKKRRCNIKHLEPLSQKLVLKKGASETEAIDVLVKAGLAEMPKIVKRELKPETQEKPQAEAPKSEPKPEKKRLFKLKPKTEKKPAKSKKK